MGVTARTHAREVLTELNEQCEAICRDRTQWIRPWRGEGYGSTPNFRLIYSTPETFDHTGGVMILGTNPGGTHAVADRFSPWAPFTPKSSATRFSSYLDEPWGGFRPGEHPIQRSVRSVSTALARQRPGGERLLRTSPTGNLIPFRSSFLGALPEPLVERGLSFGRQLIELADPSVLVLISSRERLWNWLMDWTGHATTPDHDKQLAERLWYREAHYPRSDPGLPQLRTVLAMPALNTSHDDPSSQARKNQTIAYFRSRLDALAIRWPHA